MKTKTSLKPVCFVCPICSGQIIPSPVKGEINKAQWRCKLCATTYGPSWNIESGRRNRGTNLLKSRQWNESRWGFMHAAYKNLKCKVLNCSAKMITWLIASRFF